MRSTRAVLACFLAIFFGAPGLLSGAEDGADWSEAAPGLLASKLERRPAGPLPLTLTLSAPAAKFVQHIDEIRAIGIAPAYANPLDADDERRRQEEERIRKIEAERKRAAAEYDKQLIATIKGLTPEQRKAFDEQRKKGLSANDALMAVLPQDNAALEALIGLGVGEKYGATGRWGTGGGWGGGNGTGGGNEKSSGSGTFGSSSGGGLKIKRMAGGKASESGAPGVTAGGVKDIGVARGLIEKGQIPDALLFHTEGLLSEHSIALGDVPRDKGLLYPAASLAYVRRYGHAQPEALIQLGFGANLPDGKFTRPDLNLAIVIDCSGSMGGDRIAAARAALKKILAQLNERDRVAIVGFDNVPWIIVDNSAVTDALRGQADALIDKYVVARGGTNIESGLKAGIEQLAAHMLEGGRQHRVILITDACPNRGAVSAEQFLPMLQGAAAREIGLSIFGVGVHFGAELAADLAQTPLANSHYLENSEKLEKVFDQEFDFIVTPVATNVEIKVHPQHGCTITDATGVPNFKRTAGGTAETVSLKIPTLFFSAREGGGAALVALKLPAAFTLGTALADVSLSFRTTGQYEGAPHLYAQTLRLAPPAATPFSAERAFYSHDGVRKATLLAELVSAYKTACTAKGAPRPSDMFWADEQVVTAAPAPGPALWFPAGKHETSGAAQRFSRFLDWFAAQSSGLNELEDELRLAEKLEALLYAQSAKPRPAARTISAVNAERVPAPPLDF